MRVELTRTERALAATLEQHEELGKLWQLLAAMPLQMSAATGFVQQRKAAWEAAGKMTEEAKQLTFRLESILRAMQKEAGRILDERALLGNAPILPAVE